MTLAASADCSPDTQDTPTGHEKAIDLLLQDREMIARLLREHQMLHEAFHHSPIASAITDREGQLLLSNACYDRLHAADTEGRLTFPDEPGHEPHECDLGHGALYRIHADALPNGMVARTATKLSAKIAADPRYEVEIQRIRDEAEAQIRAKSDFLSNMSHEIRTPINGLLGMASLLAESGLSKGQQMYADVVLRSGEALLAITNDILDLSKIETGQMDLDRISFDITDCIEETATLFAANADEKGLDLIVRIDPALPCRLIGDERRLRQVVTNLLGNAIRYTEAGHVMLDLDATLQSRDDGRRVARLTCRIQDTGPGIPADRCAMIFNRAPHAKSGAPYAKQGTGLGLAIVDALVTMMGGTIGVDSIEGEGTTFHFTIDLPVDASETMRTANEASQGKRVLLVDSANARRTIVTEAIKAWGFQAVSCTGIREAFAFMDEMDAQGLGVDLVLLGEHLAEGPASLFTGALKDRTGPQPPVILMARLASLSICDDHEEAGVMMVATLPRPVQTKTLLESMERAMLMTPRQPKAPKPVPVPRPAPTPQPAQAPTRAQVTSAPNDTAGQNPGDQDAAPPAPAPSDLDILVAEDNEINQFLIEEILRDSGYKYRIVGDGRAAVDAWRQERPRLILMDVSMPIMSGDDATMQIRAEEEGKTRVPIIAVTAHALRGDRERCIRAGMDDHLTKPVTVDSIMNAVHYHLRDTRMLAKA